MPRVWVNQLIRYGLLALAGLVIGALYEQPLVGLCFALLIMLAIQLYWSFRLYNWLHGERIRFLPEGFGIWPEIFAKIKYSRGRIKRRGKRFKALLKQMRQATRSFPDGGVILGPALEIMTLNKVAEKMLGLKRKKDRGMRIENLIRDPEFVAYLHAEDRSTPAEIAAPTNAGCWLSCHMVPYGLDQHLLLVRDITHERRADEMRRDFVANASHELRTPLTVITGYLDALADDAGLDPALQNPVKEMQGQSDRMRRLVDELLHLSELESEGLAPEDSRVNVAAQLKAARQAVKASGNAPQTIEININSDAGILGDEGNIQSVVSNLVANAARYTPEDGSISISWDTTPQGGFLTVEDSGVGIAADHLPRLTERFYRVENGRQRLGGEGGNGLGLAIVKHALLRHSADIKIESELGQGSRFTCIFPADRIASAT